MLFAKNAREIACAKALQTMHLYMQQCSNDGTMDIATKIKTLQWIAKKIPEVNRLLIAIQTEEVNRK